jgi:hypothetical protein
MVDKFGLKMNFVKVDSPEKERIVQVEEKSLNNQSLPVMNSEITENETLN